MGGVCMPRRSMRHTAARRPRAVRGEYFSDLLHRMRDRGALDAITAHDWRFRKCFRIPTKAALSNATPRVGDGWRPTVDTAPHHLCLVLQVRNHKRELPRAPTRLRQTSISPTGQWVDAEIEGQACLTRPARHG
jgi:hypothetical protein